jgi:hypothetical protein
VTSTDTKLRVSGIDHVVLHVGDLERARLFYVELLGFDVADEFPGHIFLQCGTQMVGLFEHRGELYAHSEMNHLALRLSAGDYDTVNAVLEAPGSWSPVDLVTTTASTSTTPTAIDFSSSPPASTNDESG